MQNELKPVDYAEAGMAFMMTVDTCRNHGGMTLHEAIGKTLAERSARAGLPRLPTSMGEEVTQADRDDLIKGFFLPKTLETRDQGPLPVTNARTNFGVTHVDITEPHYPHGKYVGAYGPCSYSVGNNGQLKGTLLYLEPAPLQSTAHRTQSTAALQSKLDMAREALRKSEEQLAIMAKDPADNWLVKKIRSALAAIGDE